VARAERRRPAPRERRFSWWWLALPALAIAGYAAFAATLSLLGDDGARAPSAVQEPPQRLVMPGPGAPPVSGPANVPDVVPAPAVAPAADAAAPSVATAGPDPSATPPQRAAADDGAARKVKPKRAPQEHLTDQDRRALDAIVEQAGKNAR
jgi:hypothetical protein